MLGDVLKRRIVLGGLIAAGAFALIGAGSAIADTSLRVVGPIPGNGTPPEPMELQHALEIAFDGSGAGRAYVQKGQAGGCTAPETGCPSGETDFTFRYLFDPNSISMDNNKRHNFVQLFRDEATNRRTLAGTYRLNTVANPDEHFIKFKTKRDDGTTAPGQWIQVPDTVSTIEVSWSRSSGVDTNDGSVSVFLNGVLVDTISGVDNDTMRVDWVRIGCVGGVDLNTNGTHYFDNFESFR